MKLKPPLGIFIKRNIQHACVLQEKRLATKYTLLIPTCRSASHVK